MKGAFLYLMFALTLFSCQRNGTAENNVPESGTTAPAPPDSAYLIVPGNRVGHVQLGIPSNDELKSMLGKADSSNAAMGKALMFWLSTSGSGAQDYLTVYTTADFSGANEGQHIVEQVQVTSPKFRTEGQIGTGKAFAQIRQQFPRLQPLAYYTNSNKQQVYLYDDVQLGITFEITLPDSTCNAITIHQKGEDVTETYLPLHPNIVKLPE
ncbi:hypothetical protein [Pontibacter harenae]|uniref:hypothetical protein n=1 Tax=Pontibacter harenae TaxID=2894083 RepID=UPI001E2E59E2|nr:hypothetical protein [Pontibacter harenae]MCC9168358.1 hypothetical protein [Pontibacter harenae]